MRSLRPPGVYYQKQVRQPRVVAPVRTDVAGFVGIAQRGPLHDAVRIESWSQFRSVFGGHNPQGYLAFAVYGFFANGGQTCWVVRAADPDAAKPASSSFVAPRGQRTIWLEARDPGTGGQAIRYVVVRLSRERFTMTLEHSGGIREVWDGLTADPEDEDHYVVNVLSKRSRLVTAEAHPSRCPAGAASVVGGPSGVLIGFLEGGADGLRSLRPEHLAGNPDPKGDKWGLQWLEEIDEVGIVAIPDTMNKPRPEPNVWVECHCQIGPGRSFGQSFAVPIETEFPPDFDHGQIFDIQQAVVRQCEKLRDRFAVLDIPHELASEERTRYGGDFVAKVAEWRDQFASKHAAIYFPWIMVLDPRSDDLPVSVPPSGHVAGMFARVDNRLGVHKPPANEVLEEVHDVTFHVTDEQHAELNDLHVNVVRPLAGRSVRVMGERTLAPDDDVEWRYVKVRRLVTMIVEAIDESMQWTTFRPNEQSLWIEIHRVVSNFLDGLWRLGMLDGAAAADAYSVRCDESTNPQEQIELGRVHCEVGLQPPQPAEFITVVICRTESGTEVLTMNGKTYGSNG